MAAAVRDDLVIGLTNLSVAVNKPRFSVDADEFGFVLEIYDVTKNTKMSDVIRVYSQFKDEGFDFKWLSSSTGLAIFSSPTSGMYLMAPLLFNYDFSFTP